MSDSVAWRKPYQDFQDFRIYGMRDLFVDEVANLTVVNCLNQDFQDFRTYRMRDSVIIAVPKSLYPRLLQEVGDLNNSNRIKIRLLI
ncbi:MAG: hypothetical protein AN484_12540 [Aphanizomenon flos-aquae WA102]|uniref:Uncharacterized protein n=1 Tax=Aphanizomenon flos-aquae WA102 TaxID=1710896 RepID=A0A1B7X212_APHFL|nr:MAG: hypothetical protein AN484_12540 [Aphanizomenon flos-aquae WA102]